MEVFAGTRKAPRHGILLVLRSVGPMSNLLLSLSLFPDEIASIAFSHLVPLEHHCRSTELIEAPDCVACSTNSQTKVEPFESHAQRRCEVFGLVLFSLFLRATL